MKKYIYIIYSIMLVCSYGDLKVNAEETTIDAYNDGIVSFDYDTNCICKITRVSAEESVLYLFTTSMKESDEFCSASITFWDTEEYEKANDLEPGTWKENIYKTESENNEVAREVWNDGDFPEMREENLETGALYCSRVIGYADTFFVTASYSVPDSDSEFADACEIIYNSCVLSEDCVDFLPLPEEESYTEIYKNVILSDQMAVYANKGIEILESYLSFDLTADEAKEQIDDLNKRIESYKEISEYTNDSDVYYALSLTEFDLDSGDDADIIETVNELKDLVKNN